MAQTLPLRRTLHTVSPLVYATSKGIVALVDLLLPKLKDINQHFDNGSTCLTIAAGNNEVALAQKFLDAGAGVDVPTKRRRLTPLHLAAENACEEIVELLLCAGASPHARSDTLTTPFYQAARGGSLYILRRLHACGAEVDALTWDRWTPLMEAVVQGHFNVVNLLLDWGADPANTSISGITPLSIASDSRHLSHVRSIIVRAIEHLSPNAQRNEILPGIGHEEASEFIEEC